MKKILVIGASGFVGRNLTKQLIADGYSVRCLARTPDKIRALATAGCEVVQGDVSDLASLQKATLSVDAVCISIQTAGTQSAHQGTKDFMDVEIAGLQNILGACQQNKVNRVIYISFLGTSPDAKSSWIRGRWKGEQLLLKSGLNATIIRPGMIVGIGGQGFNAVLSNAKKGTAMVMGNGKQRFRCIAISDLVYYLTGILNEPKAFGQAYDVGGDELYNMDQMIDIVANILKNPHPKKFHLPMGGIRALSFILEPMMKMQKGALKGLIDSMETELIGVDPKAITKILPRTLLSFEQAAEKAIESTQ
ncbi:SDR family oxidoreductase [Mucilaginibacter sp.]|uniref:SDR family oxidoreductase n=1 Tax=Mucilaginibacter sp. TaxID=1882438 RepID=UPI003B0073CF